MYSGSWFLASTQGRFRAAAGRVGDENEVPVRGVGFGREGGPGDDESFDGDDESDELIEVVVVIGVDSAVWSSVAGCFFNMGDLNGLERIELDSSSRLRFAAFMMVVARGQADRQRVMW